MASIWRPARHELCPCYVRPIAAAIDEPAFKCLTIPAIRAPRGMNFVHTSRDYPLQELSKLFQLCFTKLLSLVVKHSNMFAVSLAYSQHCGRVGHRHFYRKRHPILGVFFCISVGAGSARPKKDIACTWAGEPCPYIPCYLCSFISPCPYGLTPSATSLLSSLVPLKQGDNSNAIDEFCCE